MADNSKFARLYVIVLLPLLTLRFIIHLLFLSFSPEKEIIKSDLENECKQYKIDFRRSYLKLLWGLRFDPYFLNLFYYRIGPSRASLCRQLKNGITSFVIIDGGEMRNIKLFHPFGTIINAISLGNNVSIRNNTTIGNTHGSQNNRPIIGDNVDIGANVSIIGKITIGNNVSIGTGTIVCKNIPDNAIIVGNPAKIIGYNENS